MHILRLSQTRVFYEFKNRPIVFVNHTAKNSLRCSLRVLRLSQTRVTDEALEHFTPLTPTLEELHLRACDMVSPQGFGHVARLAALTMLNVRYCVGWA
jgi:hypothetical protein